MSGGYRVVPAALRTHAHLLETQADQLERVLAEVAATSVPAAAFGDIPQSPQAATALTDRLHEIGRQIDAAGTRAQELSAKVNECEAGYTTADDAVADRIRTMLGLPTHKQQAGVAPPATGPFAAQITANRDKVATALDAERARLADLLAQQARYDKRSRLDRFFDGGAGKALDEKIRQAENRVALYEDILANNRQIVVFDPSGNGRIAEQFGTIDATTKHVGVLVPGTFSSMANHEPYAHTAQMMVDADPNHDLAMLVYTDGRSPQSLGLDGAGSPTYATTMGPDLAAFSHQVRDAAGGADITYLGHSYGASTVGAAELNGLDSDRIVRVEGAGMGPGIWRPGDLPDAGHTTDYSMTAADDPITLVQGDSLAYPIVNGVKDFLGLDPNLGVPHDSPHGADPDTFPGTVVLDPGYVPHNPLLPGIDVNEHTAVLKPYSPSWWNLYDVVTGQPVKTLP